MQIVQAPQAILSEKAKPIHEITKQITDLIEEMKQTLLDAKDPEGVGLAAPQVGKSLQLFIVKQSPTAPFNVFINPHIQLVYPKTPKRERKNDGKKHLEGCLSLQNIWGNVIRTPKVIATYLDETGTKQHKTFSGFAATILQHEHDHLHGILFPKRVLEQKGTLYKSHKDAAGDDVFEAIEI